MEKSLDVVRAGTESAIHWMEEDFRLVDKLGEREKPLLRLYRFSHPAMTYGYFINPFQFVKKEQGYFELARRPTGGGIIPHALDFTFTFACPARHPLWSLSVEENYRVINSALAEALFKCERGADCTLAKNYPAGRHGPFCMAGATRYDLLLSGKKIGGAAERKTKKGLLHQSTLFCVAPAWDELAGALENGAERVSLMQQESAFLCAADDYELFWETLAAAFAETLGRAVR